MNTNTPQHQIRMIVGALRSGSLDNDTATASLALLDSATLAQTLVDVVSRADGARALFCDEDGHVDGEEPGWFDVEAYSTKERWEGPELNDGGLTGFTSLEAAIEYAKSDALKACYEVVVTAYGDHKEYTSCSHVWRRNNRPYPDDLGRKITLTLFTSDGRVGTSVLGSSEPTEWDSDGDDETVAARFELICGGEVLQRVEIDGDSWRDLESSGCADEIASDLESMESLRTALDDQLGITDVVEFLRNQGQTHGFSHDADSAPGAVSEASDVLGISLSEQSAARAAALLLSIFTAASMRCIRVSTSIRWFPAFSQSLASTRRRRAPMLRRALL